jgi:hypothetical protein
MGKYFASKGPDTDIVKYATALNVDPRDLLGCVEDTTSNTARQVTRLLYPSEKLLSMTGPEIPKTQRSAIRSNYILHFKIKNFTFYFIFKQNLLNHKKVQFQTTSLMKLSMVSSDLKKMNSRGKKTTMHRWNLHLMKVLRNKLKM